MIRDERLEFAIQVLRHLVVLRRDRRPDFVSAGAMLAQRATGFGLRTPGEWRGQMPNCGPGQRGRAVRTAP